VSSGRLFASLGLKLGGKIFAMDSRGRLVVKVSAARAKALFDAGHGEPFDPGHGRLMKQWVAVVPGAKLDWVSLSREALDFARAQAAKR
jgi:hypothetical protein